LYHRYRQQHHHQQHQHFIINIISWCWFGLSLSYDTPLVYIPAFAQATSTADAFWDALKHQSLADAGYSTAAMERDVIVDMIKVKFTGLCTTQVPDLADKTYSYCKSVPESVAPEIRTEFGKLKSALSLLLGHEVALDEADCAITFISSQTESLFCKVLSQWPAGRTLIAAAREALDGKLAGGRLTQQSGECLRGFFEQVAKGVSASTLEALTVVTALYDNAAQLGLTLLSNEDHDSQVEKCLVTLTNGLKSEWVHYCQRFIEYMSNHDDHVFWEVEPDLANIALCREHAEALAKLSPRTPYLKHFVQHIVPAVVLMEGVIDAMPGGRFLLIRPGRPTLPPNGPLTSIGIVVSIATSYQ
jgi:hypothetical protein